MMRMDNFPQKTIFLTVVNDCALVSNKVDMYGERPVIVMVNTLTVCNGKYIFL